MKKDCVCLYGEAVAQEDISSRVVIYTERKKKRRVEFFPSSFNHFLRCLL